MPRRIRENTRAPDITLQTLDGERVRLGAFWENGRQLLVIFLRHLA